MSVVIVPLERIAIDIVGPLILSSSCRNYILVVVDYTTQCPEGMPLRNISADTAAKDLVILFSRVRIPKQVITAQGTNFISKTLQAMWRILGLQLVWTPVH